MKRVYIIAGCNGAGKTTATFTILPDFINCSEFVNADEIAKGLSPLQPDVIAFEAGKLMIKRINWLFSQNKSFAIETTLATRRYLNFIKKLRLSGYRISLLFFWLNSKELALKRVTTRVDEGGHNIPENVVRRRYELGLSYFFNQYKQRVDDWILLDNSINPYKMIAREGNKKLEIFDMVIWKRLRSKYEKSR